MKYNFDEPIERKGTDCLKYDFAVKRGMPESILPLWVADMDFSSPPEVVEALAHRVRHGIFGYSDIAGEDYFRVLSLWYAQRFHWKLSPEWLIKTPGVVFALCTAIRSLTEKGDAVLIQPPVYYPFSSSILDNQRKLVTNELVYQEGKYQVNLKDFEQKIIEHQVKLFLLCSPHNPVGRVWTKEELTAMGDICVKHDVIVVADEIHADFIYPGNRHRVFAGISDAFADRTITCTAPSKTFNLAGLQISNIFIPNQVLRRRFRDELYRAGYSQPNVMGLVACQAAYTHGAAWLEALKEYLCSNLELLRSFLKERMPKVRLVEPEGTYLVWLDCRGLGISDEELNRLIVHEAGLWLDDGPMFGQGGEGFQRVNIACPKETLQNALERFASLTHLCKG